MGEDRGGCSYAPRSKDGNYLVLARYDMSEWSREKLLNPQTYLMFHNSCMKRIFRMANRKCGYDERPAADYRIQNTVISLRHLQTTGLVECRHNAIISSLAKYCSHLPASWPRHLSLCVMDGSHVSEVFN